MATYKVTLTFNGTNIKSVAKKAKKFFGEDADVAVEKATHPVSRSERLGACESDIEDARMEVESLRDELQDWLDNLPENLQSGVKADQLQEAIDGLDSIQSSLQDVDWSVDFPGMF